MSESRVVKFLALHGKQQNGGVFRKRLGRLQHQCKKFCSLNILEAPFVVLEEDRMGTIEGGPKTWFYRNKKTLVVDLVSLEEIMSFVQHEWDSAVCC